MKVNQYDRVASVYNPFSRVLGKSYRESKYAFLERIQEGDQVLFLGGGTGGNLPMILDRVGGSGKIYYMETSLKMIKIAKKQVHPADMERIVFLHQGDFSQIPEQKYDKVITQYFLDILTDKDIHLLFQCLKKRTEKNTQWIFVDFFVVKGKKWLVGLMIWVFQILTGNPRKDLPDYDAYFNQYGWCISLKQSFDQGLIQAWLLEKD